MQPATRFAGFEAPGTAASIMVTELAAPITGATAGFRDPARLAAQRMTLIKAEQLTQPQAELFTLSQRYAGDEFRKLILATGDATRTILITATTDAPSAATWEPAFRAAFATVTIGPPQANAVGFHIEPQADFKPARALSGSLALTPGGVLGPNLPLFLATRSIAPVPVAALAEFGENRARALPNVSTFRTTYTNPITIDGLTGLRLTGIANESTPTAQLVHETILRDPAAANSPRTASPSQPEKPPALLPASPQSALASADAGSPRQPATAPTPAAPPPARTRSPAIQRSPASADSTTGAPPPQTAQRQSQQPEQTETVS
jgi:hypothetical protein